MAIATRRARDDAGSAAAELVLLVPLLATVMGFYIVAGVLWFDRQVLNGAARSAVEAAALRPTAVTAGDVARRVVRDDVSGSRLSCSHLATRTDTTEFRPGGWLSVSVTCGARLPRLPFVAVSSSLRIRSTARTTLEPYRLVGR